MKNLTARFKTTWAIYKIWFIIGGSLVLAVGIAALLWPKSPEQKIRAAIEQYHENKGQTVKIEILGFRLIAESFSDSIKLHALIEKGKYYIEQRHQLNNTFSRDTLYADSVELITKEINAVRDDIKTKKALTFTRCEYIAQFSGVEQYSDTLTAVLNSSFLVVWPD